MEQRETALEGGLRTDQDTYHDAFARFLAGTDEKTTTHAYLDQVVNRLPTRRVFIDVGPADGVTTRHVGRFFQHTVCIEPSAPMRQALARTCPDAVVLADPVLQARPGVSADLALLSHVLYYVPRRDWVKTVQRIMEWVEPSGTFLVLLQKPDNACMRMVHHFTGKRFDLEELADELAATSCGLIGDVRLDTVPARYRSTDVDETVAVAGFHLSVPKDHSGNSAPLAREAVKEYVQQHFKTGERDYCINHDQQVLRIERPAS